MYYIRRHYNGVKYTDFNYQHLTFHEAMNILVFTASCYESRIVQWCSDTLDNIKNEQEPTSVLSLRINTPTPTAYYLLRHDDEVDNETE